MGPIRNKIEAVRNRTGCRIYLLYYKGTSLYYREAMVPHSDDSVIDPLNQIDAIGLTNP